MNKPNRHITLAASGLFFIKHAVSVAQNKIQEDSTDITVTYFKEGILDRYSGNDFNYNINDTGGVNLLQQLLRKFFNWLGDIFGIDIDFVDYETLEYIVYGLLAAGALYLFIKFLLQSPMSSVFKTEEKTIDNFGYIEEDIQQVDFENLIKTALKESNYRLATRYLYLKSLKNLTNKNIIDWHYDKTNSDYLNEISDDGIKQLFKRISYIYDYVWYGEFAIDEQAFNRNQDDFSTLNKRING
ncbi:MULTISPECIES: hypothetical protein [Bizionia]|uniref:DUF4129 domain-containing protein n=1 Tax=Bizionia algoritergicola TaxID=291187 RepID=A0A5D0QPE8_9FLAO|nr:MULTISPECIES: hypothetical protein [Bizionia]OBX22536.1 hypothetical protein BAA08_07925 [Bizionia sp. APA-3]TYB70726.1 hypothetical protein ES675_14545 [Bizionia algoritergicola]